MNLQLVQSILAQATTPPTTCGHEWPDSAEFAIVERVSTWPIGWSDSSSIKFFDSKSELDAHIDNMRKWEQLEDNLWAFRTYNWDLGPRLFSLSQFDHTPHTTRDRVISITH